MNVAEALDILERTTALVKIYDRGSYTYEVESAVAEAAKLLKQKLKEEMRAIDS